MHVGQHGGASYPHIMAASVPVSADDPDAADLLAELRRIYRLVKQLAAARERAAAARRTGDDPGYRYSIAEARRCARILAEG